jgi:hypothetical protein
VRHDLTILVAARDEAGRIGPTVAALHRDFPGVEVIVADDGSRDGTADEAEAAGAVVLRLSRHGKGGALSAAERAAPPGALLLCDADLRGDLRPLTGTWADLAVARFAERRGGGFGVAKRIARLLVRVRCGYDAAEPLSGQRALSPAARSACFPLAPGFGCDARMTVDAVRRGCSVVEIELDLDHRATGRDLPGFLHRGRQLRDILLALGPLAVNYRGARLPVVGSAVAVAGVRAPRTTAAAVAAIALVGLADDVWSGAERGFRQHLAGRRTTGVLKLVAIPAIALAATRSLSAAALVALSANSLNQLDTRPGRALKAFGLAAFALRGPALPFAVPAVLLAPYDLGEMAMLGDGGSNALGAVVGFAAVGRLSRRGRFVALAALTTLTAVGELRSLGAAIERTPGLAAVDRLGRRP